jgi:hypothetical protein
MKWLSVFIALCLFPCIVLAYPSVYPTGTVRYNPEKAWNGYTLIDDGNTVSLIDMNGNLLHAWKIGEGHASKMLPGGQVISGRGTWSEGQQDIISLQQLDWDGNLLWEFRKLEAVPAIPGQSTENGKTWISRQHHEFQREGPPYFTPAMQPKNQGKTLILAHRNLKNPKIHKTMQLLDDVLIEVAWDGQILWQWGVADHVDELGFDDDAFKGMQSFPPWDNPVASRHASSKKIGAGYDWFHANSAAYLGPNKWYDQGDQRFNPDNVIINSREANVMVIADRKTGKVVWRLGPDFRKGTPDEKIGQIIGPHSVHMIPRGLPGEGNIIVFDNGGTAGYGTPNAMAQTGFHNVRRDYSRVLEINPVTKDIVWEYRYSKTTKRIPGHFDYNFFSPFVSFAQRLPNGNTVITEGDCARVFEVTPDMKTVWEHVVGELVDKPLPLYRTYRVPYEWAPQLPKPKETAVVPPNPVDFKLPDVNGNYPKGAKAALKAQPASGTAAPASPVKPDGGKIKAGEQPGVHSY